MHREKHAIHKEAEVRRRFIMKNGPVVRVTTVLLLGVWKLRAEYAERVAAWRELRELPAGVDPNAPNAHDDPPEGASPSDDRPGGQAGTVGGDRTMGAYRCAAARERPVC